MARKQKKQEREPSDYPEHLTAVRSLVIRLRAKNYSESEIVATVSDYIGQIGFLKTIELAAKQVIRESEGYDNG